MQAIKNFIILFIGDIVNYLLNFFVVIYLARILGVTNFGIINFAFAFYGFSTFITNLGLISIGTRDIAQQIANKHKNYQNQYILNVLNLRLVLSIVAFVILLLIALIINKPVTTKLLIILYGLSLFPFAMILEWVFFGWEKMEYVALERIIIAITYLALIMLLVKSIQHMILIPIIFLISNFLGMVFLFYQFNKQKGTDFKLKWQMNLKEWQSLIKNALPIGLGALLIQFSTNFSIVFLGLIKSDEAVGLFSSANKLLIFILIFDRVFCNTTFPIISRYYLDGKEKLTNLLMYLSKFIFLTAIPICTGSFILAPKIINFIYGTNYLKAFRILQILIWYLLITMLNSLYTTSLIAGKRNREYLFAIGFGVLTNILLNIILVPQKSAFGTAIALITAELITLLVLIQKIKPIGQIKFKFIDILKPLIATLIMILFIKLTLNKLSLIPLIILASIVYLVIIIIIKGITINDLKYLKITQ